MNGGCSSVQSRVVAIHHHELLLLLVGLLLMLLLSMLLSFSGKSTPVPGVDAIDPIELILMIFGGPASTHVKEVVLW